MGGRWVASVSNISAPNANPTILAGYHRRDGTATARLIVNKSKLDSEKEKKKKRKFDAGCGVSPLLVSYWLAVMPGTWGGPGFLA